MCLFDVKQIHHSILEDEHMMIEDCMMIERIALKFKRKRKERGGCEEIVVS